MLRRDFFRTLLGLSLLPVVGRAEHSSAGRSILIQESPIAGFQYHEGEDAWSFLAVGDELSLVREPYNRHDKRAVAVHWRGRKLGYVPRVENTALYQMMDCGVRFEARIVALQESAKLWKRLQFSVWLVEAA